MLERLFHLRAAGTTVGRELLGGVTTFLTLSYILVVNPVILAAAGMPIDGAVAATALSAAFATLLMAFVANYPVALAPGMGLNAFFAFGICRGAGVPWPTALGIVFWAGILFLGVTATGLRAALVRAVPRALVHAGTAGIGLFIAFIGLRQGALLRSDPDTLVALADLTTRPAWIALSGLAVALALHARGVRTATFWGLAAAFAAAVVSGGLTLPARPFALPNFTLPGLSIDLVGALSPSYLPLLLTTLFFALFDTLGTLLAIARQAGFATPAGEIPRLGRALTSDAAGMVGGSLFGTSAVTSYIESGAGVAVGARTGLANVATGSLLGLSLFAAPLVGAIGRGVEGANPIAAPALVLVGAMMAGAVREIEWHDPTEAVPAFLAMIAMPFTFNIAHGLAAGFLAYVGLKAAAGRGREVHPLLWGLALLLALRYAFLPL